MDGMALPAGSEDCVNLLYTDYESTYQEIDRDGITKILSSVEQERPDITIALLHWGSEYNDTISPTQEKIVTLMQENGVDAIIGTHPHFVQKMVFDQEEGTFVAYSLGDLISDADRSGTQYSVVLDLEITKNLRNGKTSIANFSYTPIYTVAEEGQPLRVVRIHEAIQGYESYFIGRATEAIYNDMLYALQRIQARTTGE
jgi:poly-gamma-glutamate synthesis protein (capsule biosynthesis protein)